MQLSPSILTFQSSCRLSGDGKMMTIPPGAINKKHKIKVGKEKQSSLIYSGFVFNFCDILTEQREYLA